MKRSWVAALCVCAIAGAVPALIAQVGPPDGGMPGWPQRAEPKEISGTVQSFNLGPQGTPEGIMLKGEQGVIQVNLNPMIANALGDSVKVGDKIKASVVEDFGGPGGRGPGGGGNQGGPGGAGGRRGNRGGGGQGGGADGAPQGGPDGAPPGGPEGGPPQADHPVFMALSLTDAAGKEHGGAMRGGDEKHAHGAVKTINYDRRGMPNGVVLEDGTFVRIPGRAANELALKVGDNINVDGPGMTLPNGKLMINANTINGEDIRPQGGPGGGPGGWGGGPGGGGPGGPPN